ncbi:unnamed protein product [Gadus morhua 'NCC']
MSLKDAWARVPAWHRCAAERNLMPERKLVLWKSPCLDQRERSAIRPRVFSVARQTSGRRAKQWTCRDMQRTVFTREKPHHVCLAAGGWRRHLANRVASSVRCCRLSGIVVGSCSYESENGMFFQSSLWT